MTTKAHNRIVFILSLISGVALCIGGIYLAPLLIPGGVLLGAAFAMYQGAFTVAAQNEANAQVVPEEALDEAPHQHAALPVIHNTYNAIIYNFNSKKQSAPKLLELASQAPTIAPHTVRISDLSAAQRLSVI